MSEIQPRVRKLLCILGSSISPSDRDILVSSPPPCFSCRPQYPETGLAAQRQQLCNFALAGVTMVMRAAEKPFFNVGNTQVHAAVWGAGVILESELCLMEQRMF